MNTNEIYYSKVSVVDEPSKRWSLCSNRNTKPCFPRICQANINEGSAAGGDELFLIVERVSKRNILVRFFELDDRQKVVWEAVIAVPDPDITQQYSIVCQTPAYRDPEITKPVPVNIQLVRPSDNRCSNPPIKFVYKPYIPTIKSRRPCCYGTTYYPVSPISQDFTTSASAHRIEATTSASISSISSSYGLEGAAPTSQTNVSSQQSPSRSTVTALFVMAPSECISETMKTIPPKEHHKALQEPSVKSKSIQMPRNSKSTFPSLPLVKSTSVPSLSSDISFPALPKPHVRTPKLLPVLAPLQKSLLAKSQSTPVLAYGKPTKTSKARANFNSIHHNSVTEQQRKQSLLPPASKSSHSSLSVVADPPTRRRSTQNKYVAPRLARSSCQRMYQIFQRMSKGNYSPRRYAHGTERILELWAEHISESADGDSPLHETVALGELQAVNKMCLILYQLEMTALIDRSTNMFGRNALHLACFLGRNEFVHPLLTAGANPNRQDQCGNTALHIAVRQCHVACVKQLLRLPDRVRASFMLRNERGHTPIHLAIRRNHHGIAELLLRTEPSQACIGVSATSGSNALQLALLHRNRKIIELILTSPNVEELMQQRNVFGKTAFDLAKQYELSDMLIRFEPTKQDTDYNSFATKSNSTFSDDEDNITVVENPLFNAQDRRVVHNANQSKVDAALEDLTLVMAAAEHFRYLTPFVHHSVPKMNNFRVDVLPHYDDRRFASIVRVSADNFKFIADLIRADDAFNGPRSSRQFSVEMQLSIVMYRLGCSGEGASLTKVAALFGIGDGGTIQNVTERVFNAILKLMNQYLYWPTVAERKVLAAETKHELPNCIGYVDGTEIKLAEKPSQDPEAYFSRKQAYSLKVQAVCDYKLRIRHLVLGYPGSVHDARIYNSCDLAIQPSEYFSGEEWLAGDSAYKLTTTVITPFRSNSRDGSVQQRNNFNTTFSQYRVRIEHCFGVLKERFNSLKELKLSISNDSSIKKACHWILVCAILHNILIERNDMVEFEHNDASATEDEEPDGENYNCGNVGERKRRTILELLESNM